MAESVTISLPLLQKPAARLLRQVWCCYSYMPACIECGRSIRQRFLSIWYGLLLLLLLLLLILILLLFCNGNWKVWNPARIKFCSHATKSAISSCSQHMQRLLDISWQPWKISPKTLCVWEEACDYLDVTRSRKVVRKTCLQCTTSSADLQSPGISICCSCIYSLEVYILGCETCNCRDFPFFFPSLVETI